MQRFVLALVFVSGAVQTVRSETLSSENVSSQRAEIGSNGEVVTLRKEPVVETKDLTGITMEDDTEEDALLYAGLSELMAETTTLSGKGGKGGSGKGGKGSGREEKSEDEDEEKEEKSRRRRDKKKKHHKDEEEEESGYSDYDAGKLVGYTLVADALYYAYYGGILGATDDEAKYFYDYYYVEGGSGNQSGSLGASGSDSYDSYYGYYDSLGASEGGEDSYDYYSLGASEGGEDSYDYNYNSLGASEDTKDSEDSYYDDYGDEAA